jgi:hypothetical protein
VKQPDPETLVRLLFLLHRAWVEARLLATGGKHQQLFDLADAVETLPGYLANWSDEHLASLRFNLEKYQEKYAAAGVFDYLAYIQTYRPPERF